MEIKSLVCIECHNIFSFSRRGRPPQKCPSCRGLKRGGRGDLAQTNISRLHDITVKSVVSKSHAIQREIEKRGWVWRPTIISSFDKKDAIQRRPDLGVIYKQTQKGLVCLGTGDSKHQGEVGNAIERAGLQYLDFKMENELSGELPPRFLLFTYGSGAVPGKNGNKSLFERQLYRVCGGKFNCINKERSLWSVFVKEKWSSFGETESNVLDWLDVLD